LYRRLRELQAGSSIMPGKINPVIPEAVGMACVQVMGLDAAVAMAGANAPSCWLYGR
jgi:fumarate hydratase class II